VREPKRQDSTSGRCIAYSSNNPSLSATVRVLCARQKAQAQACNRLCCGARDRRNRTLMLSSRHTPGHTPKRICFLVTDHTRADEPWFVRTGHPLDGWRCRWTELAEDAASGARTLFEGATRPHRELAGCIFRFLEKCEPPHIETFFLRRFFQPEAGADNARRGSKRIPLGLGDFPPAPMMSARRN
jgi:hypothetical protein